MQLEWVLRGLELVHDHPDATAWLLGENALRDLRPHEEWSLPFDQSAVLKHKRVVQNLARPSQAAALEYPLLVYVKLDVEG